MYRWKSLPAAAGFFVSSWLSPGAALAAPPPPLTLIQDVLHKADGSRFDGLVIIEWKTFEASDTSLIAKNRVRQAVVKGNLSVRLVPTTTAGSPAYYSVRYVSSGSPQFTEAWAVRPSATPLRVKDVRIPDPILGPSTGSTGGGQTTPIEIDQVNGLRQELDLRARQGLGYAPSRAARINPEGELEAVLGGSAECVRVDGTAGPCGGGGPAELGPPVPVFVDMETPAGIINGANQAFQLSQSPNPVDSLLLYRNGLLQKRTFDYDVSGATVTFLATSVPQIGDTLLASYRTPGTAGATSRVICSATGSSTSQTSAASLGTCTIPAGALRAGDRVEVSFDYLHQGTTSAFEFLVRWGAATIVSRGAGASALLATGRLSVGIDPGTSTWSVQTWGSGLSHAVDSGTVSDSLANPITVDFLGFMSSATSDLLTLRSYTVVLHTSP